MHACVLSHFFLQIGRFSSLFILHGKRHASLYLLINCLKVQGIGINTASQACSNSLCSDDEWMECTARVWDDAPEAHVVALKKKPAAWISVVPLGPL